MRLFLAPVLTGAVGALVLYGILSASERRVRQPEDPWLDAWVGEGMKADFRSASQDPAKDALTSDARDALAGPEFAGTSMRLYLVQNISVQVLRFPRAGLAPGIAEGRHFEFRFRPEGNPVHVCRRGGTLLLASIGQKSLLGLGQMKASRGLVEQIFSAFEETATRYP